MGAMERSSGGTRDLRSGVTGRDELAELYAVTARQWVRAGFVSTLDGRVGGPDGLSGSIGSPADKVVFDTVRALADVVVVASGTLRAEGYTRLATAPDWLDHRERAGRPPHPPLVAVTASGDLPERLLQERPDTGDLVVAVTRRTDPRRVAGLRDRLGDEAVLVCGTDEVEPEVLLEQLAERGWHHVLLEGGPSLLAQWVDAEVVDELCLTLRPLLLGGGGPSLITGAPERVRQARLLSVLSLDDDLMLRYRLR
jgi:riboflavin biosynthesis pyrimidine reductase